jgi:hypothetical protein
MKPELVIAIAVAVPIVLFPVAYVWYLTLGGIRAAVQEARKKAARKETTA